MSETSTLSPPLAPFIRRDKKGAPWLVGSRCEACGALFVGDREACAACTARGRLKQVRLAETGKLYAFCVVHRSFPGVSTPFVDAVVDLDDGAHLKGTLLDAGSDPSAIPFGMPVRVIYRDATPVNAPDKPHLTHFFVPA
jgi:uncharacterized OB-fold protein